jgi:hypothetical protein
MKKKSTVSSERKKIIKLTVPMVVGWGEKATDI